MVFLLIILGLIPSLAWLVFFLQEDIDHPEPRKLIVYVFFAGIASTLFVLQGQILVNSWFTSFGIHIYSLVSLFVLAGVEEFFKFGAAYAVMKGRKELNEAVDPMIYMITAALGFAAIENIASLFRLNDGIALTVDSLETTILRFVGATLLHSLSSGLVGYYWGRSMVTRESFWGMIGKGLLFATVLHTIFNYFIIKFEPATVALLFLIFVGFFILGDFEKLKKSDSTHTV